MVVVEGWVQCVVDLVSHGKGGRALLVQNRFRRRREPQLVVGYGGVVGKSGRRGNARHMGDFLAQIQKNQGSSSVHLVYLSRKNRTINGLWGELRRVGRTT